MHIPVELSFADDYVESKGNAHKEWMLNPIKIPHEIRPTLIPLIFFEIPRPCYGYIFLTFNHFQREWMELRVANCFIGGKTPGSFYDEGSLHGKHDRSL
ncbi:hypothetical protein NPIL_267091 [Nephila pilipes]|uniref:Uncharacterized protein n=1 Tax=Nephila pilipes TaxID=299642 RepID=A0A8X6U7M0_NEPPI|nr:hypothetical protein NPIL_267091 [Nephila pilipes]